MLERLKGADSIRDAERRLRILINEHAEWLYSRDAERAAMLLRKSECDFQASHGRLKFSCWGEEGAIVWRITGWEWTGDRLLLEGSRRMGAEKARLELIPRVSLEAITAAISDTRRSRCFLGIARPRPGLRRTSRSRIPPRDYHRSLPAT